MQNESLIESTPFKVILLSLSLYVMVSGYIILERVQNFQKNPPIHYMHNGEIVQPLQILAGCRG